MTSFNFEHTLNFFLRYLVQVSFVVLPVYYESLFTIFFLVTTTKCLSSISYSFSTCQVIFPPRIPCLSSGYYVYVLCFPVIYILLYESEETVVSLCLVLVSEKIE